MADTTNAAPTEKYNDDGSLNPTYVEPKDEGEGADNAGTENKDVDTDKDGADDKKDEDAFNDTIDEKNPPKIPVRESVAQNIIVRKNKTIEKLRSKQTDDEGADDGADGGEEDTTGLTPEARNVIDKAVNDRIAPLLGKLATDADEKEFAELIKVEPEASKYANHIKAYMGHDSYKGVSPTVIYHHLAFEAAQRLGAKKKAAADLEAKQSKGGGRTIPDKGRVSNLPTSEEIAAMSDEEFEKMENDARQGKYLST